ncbi:hypothetical protein NXC24_PC00046 (plasmid) [Rhizobium sp. NXC24]|nr:hypothetical protein NXC24_PC00046 [Rhizobium sp. NXC24]
MRSASQRALYRGCKFSKLPILYDPAHPDQAQADSLFGIWLLPVVLLPPAFLIILIGATILRL